MVKRTMLAALVGVACALGAAPLRADAEYPPAGRQMKLDEGMTTEQVQALLGDPDSTEQATCGAKLGKPWSCRTWVYGKGYPTFRVLFQKVGTAWVVNSWSS